MHRGSGADRVDRGRRTPTRGGEEEEGAVLARDGRPGTWWDEGMDTWEGGVKGLTPWDGGDEGMDTLGRGDKGMGTWDGHFPQLLIAFDRGERKPVWVPRVNF